MKTVGSPVEIGQGREAWVFVRGDEGVVLWPARSGNVLRFRRISADGSIVGDAEDTGLKEYPARGAVTNCFGFIDAFASRDSHGWTVAAIGQEQMACKPGGLSLETLYVRRRTPEKWEGSTYPQMGGFVWRSSSEGMALLDKDGLHWMGPRTGRLEAVHAPLGEIGGSLHTSLFGVGAQAILVLGRGDSGWAEISPGGRIEGVPAPPEGTTRCVSTPRTWACKARGSITFINRPRSPLRPGKAELSGVGLLAALIDKDAVAHLVDDRGHARLEVIDSAGERSPPLGLGPAALASIAPIPGGFLVAIVRPDAHGGDIVLVRVAIEPRQVASP